MQGCQKLTKSRTKTLIFTTLDTSQLKKLMTESIYSVNPLYLHIKHASGYIEEKIGNKYLVFNSVDENRELLKKYADVWDGSKNKIKVINRSEKNDYRKDYMKIKFNSDDDLLLNKPLKFHLITIVIKSVFEGGKFCPQLFLDDPLYELV